MAVDRELLFAALFARLQQYVGPGATPAGPVVYFSRRFELSDDTSPVMQPALMMVKGAERPERRGYDEPLVWELTAECYLYAKDDGTNNAVASTVLNTILTAIESALEIQPGEVSAGTQFPARRNIPPAPTTLGGLCERCEMGEVEVFEDPIGHDAIVRFPVTIHTTA